ncbi:sensor histidine kinase [Novosphingobium sp. Leaf2]|uniref:sensor histidine kinase n=1 Tax=Novosphingobium sp. Leaf2 TaxID=1735670 RepID=UPI0006F24B7A|nr:sensor histidine kinase [Novosphingobium sp. Leaf2]KQM21025.1 histidine kinase [Novosphingobium sp. Leaf2]
MARPPALRFAGYVGIVFLVLGTMQLVASLLFYQSIDRQALNEDHARRIAELLVVSDRIHAADPTRTASTMTTRHLAASVAEEPTVASSPANDKATYIGRRIVEWEPSLANRSLRLALQHASTSKEDLVGSIRLADGRWLNFRATDIDAMWPAALRATTLTLAATVLCLSIGLIVLHLLTRPLRRMIDAADAIGQGRQVAVRESGSPDLRKLAHSMNVMQERIARLLQDQARSFEAISHDLRTPLARQKIAGELMDDAELGGVILASVAEMESLLASLQRFLRAQHIDAEPENVDLGALLAHVAQPYHGRAIVDLRERVVLRTFREPLVLALAALVENAIQYGDKAILSAKRSGTGWRIVVEDRGPGIPEQFFEAILDPFYRLDEARARDTGGFGLGIPTAHRLMMRFNGHLSFATATSGGLIAYLQLPVPPAD